MKREGIVLNSENMVYYIKLGRYNLAVAISKYQHNKYH